MAATAGSLEGRLSFLLAADTEAGNGVGDLKQRVTLGHILGPARPRSRGRP